MATDLLVFLPVSESDVGTGGILEKQPNSSTLIYSTEKIVVHAKTGCIENRLDMALQLF